MINYIKEIQSRLPEGIIIENEHKFSLTRAEFLSILCWVKYFNAHYKEFKMTKYPDIAFPIISARIFLDFGLYIPPKDGQHIIYIGKFKKLHEKFL